jgi:hypothetical protein
MSSFVRSSFVCDGVSESVCHLRSSMDFAAKALAVAAVYELTFGSGSASIHVVKAVVSDPSAQW